MRESPGDADSFEAIRSVCGLRIHHTAKLSEEVNRKSKCLYTRPAMCIDSAGICTRPII